MFKHQSLVWAGAVASLVMAAPAVRAQSAPAPAYSFVNKLSHTTYDVEPDGRVAETVETRVQVLQESSLEATKVFSLSYSTSIQSGEVLEAYTLKKDGRKLPVPEGNYQKQTNDGRGRAGPVFSDYTRLSVVFPDLAVGDSVHLRYRVTEKEPMFPGQFSMQVAFSPYMPYEDARITVRLPKGMATTIEAHQLQAVAPTEEGGKRILEWRYARPNPPSYNEDEDNGLWSRDEYPNLLVSTFGSYEAIATAYGDRALPKATPSPRIRELASTIVGAETQPRAKARLLYEWVSRNITYGGNCIGVGAVVPRDTDVVLDNKMGDCKDHATLLQALLAAAGIRSEQVLINAGNEYDLPRTPVVSLVNHVMNFLPELNIYADATAKEVPFGYLPAGSYGKPVIHVGASKALATVPPAEHDANEQRLRMKLKVADNGAASGTMAVSLRGLPAAATRAYMRNLTADAERDFVKQALSGFGLRGRGTVEKNETAGLTDRYEYSVKFDIDNFLRSGATGAFYFAPVMGSPMSVMNFARFEEGPLTKRPQICAGFHSYEAYDIELPASMTLLSMPDDAKFEGSMVDYTAKYERNGTTIAVMRELHDKTGQSVCPPDVMKEFQKQAVRVGENLRTQVLYKRKMTQ